MSMSLSARIAEVEEKHEPVLAWTGGAVPEPSHEVCSSCGGEKCTFEAELRAVINAWNADNDTCLGCGKSGDDGHDECTITFGKIADVDTTDARARVEEALREILDGQEAMHCTRDAWGWAAGTMSADDFALVTDDETAFAEIVDTVLEAAAGAPPMLTESQVWTIARTEHDYAGDTDNVPAFVMPLVDGLRAAGIAFDEQSFIDGGMLLPREKENSDV